jgi:hypothetical protein
VITHYVDGNPTAEWLIESANLEHVASGVCIEYRNGRVIVDGVVSVDSLPNAAELLTGEAA